MPTDLKKKKKKTESEFVIVPCVSSGCCCCNLSLLLSSARVELIVGSRLWPTHQQIITHLLLVLRTLQLLLKVMAQCFSSLDHYDTCRCSPSSFLCILIPSVFPGFQLCVLVYRSSWTRPRFPPLELWLWAWVSLYKNHTRTMLGKFSSSYLRITCSLRGRSANSMLRLFLSWGISLRRGTWNRTPSRFKLLLNWPEPTDNRQLQRFLGFFNFYCRLFSWL